MGDETTRLRPPRFLQQDGLVRAYIKEQAIGNRILRVSNLNSFLTFYFKNKIFLIIF